jgi:hypothetical protein
MPSAAVPTAPRRRVNYDGYWGPDKRLLARWDAYPSNSRVSFSDFSQVYARSSLAFFQKPALITIFPVAYRQLALPIAPRGD